MKTDDMRKKVKKDYDKIAPHFSSTRSFEWEEMREFSKYVKDGMKVLDLGCGNGRLLESLKGKDVNYMGIDQSEGLIKIARENYSNYEFRVMNMEDLKIESDSCDAVFAIASLHHLPTQKLRRQALDEAKRVLKKDGHIFVTVWNLWQPKYRKYIWGNLFNMIFYGSKTHFGDTFIPWKNQNREVEAERYYFAYTKRGLKKDLKAVKLKPTKIVNNGRNIYAICTKDY